MKSAPLPRSMRLPYPLLALELDRREHALAIEAAEAQQLGEQAAEVREHAARDGPELAPGLASGNAAARLSSASRRCGASSG